MFKKIRKKIGSWLEPDSKVIIDKVNQMEDEEQLDSRYSEENCNRFEAKFKKYSKEHRKGALIGTIAFGIVAGVLGAGAVASALVGAFTFATTAIVAGPIMLATAMSAGLVYNHYNKRLNTIDATNYYMENKKEINMFAESHKEMKKNNKNYSLQRGNSFIEAKNLENAIESTKGLNIFSILEHEVPIRELKVVKALRDYENEMDFEKAEAEKSRLERIIEEARVEAIKEDTLRTERAAQAAAQAEALRQEQAAQAEALRQEQAQAAAQAEALRKEQEKAQIDMILESVKTMFESYSKTLSSDISKKNTKLEQKIYKQIGVEVSLAMQKQAEIARENSRILGKQ